MNVVIDFSNIIIIKYHLLFQYNTTCRNIDFDFFIFIIVHHYYDDGSSHSHIILKMTFRSFPPYFSALCAAIVVGSLYIFVITRENNSRQHRRLLFKYIVQILTIKNLHTTTRTGRDYTFSYIHTSFTHRNKEP